MSLMDKIFSEGPLADAMDKNPGKLLDDDLIISEDGPYSDYDELRTDLKEFIDDVSSARRTFERIWFESMLFYLGNQWLAFDNGRKQFRQRNLKKWVPKPVTNRYASTADTIIGVLEGIEVRPTAWPSTDDPDDIASAGVADKVLRIIDDEIEHTKIKRSLAPIIVLQADAFVLPFYDKNDKSLGEMFLPFERCIFCRYEAAVSDFIEKCPNCGMFAETEPAERGEFFPFGKLKAHTINPLELYIHMQSNDADEAQEWCYVRPYTLDVIRANWKKVGKYVQATNTNSKEGQNYSSILTYMTAESSGGSGRQTTDTALVYTHFKMPCDKYPEGLVNVQAGDGTILEVGPSPFYIDGPNGRTHYNPLVHFSYRNIPSRLYGKTPMFDLINKQKQRNRLESLIEISTMKNVHNSWLLPTGSSISQLSGEPSQLIRWTPTGTNGAEPKLINSSPFPNIIIEWLRQIDNDFEEISGTFDALKGNTPKGVSAGYAIQLLTEKSYGRLSGAMLNWQTSWNKVYKVGIALFKQNVTEERLYKIKGESGQWEIEKFKGSDIAGSVDIRLEGGTNKPKTKLAEQALVETLTKLRVFDIQDPHQKYEIASLFGMAHMLGNTADDYRQTAQEWEEFKSGKPPVVRLVVDNHMVHVMDHQKRAKTSVFRQLPDEMQQMWEKHISDHIMIISQQGQAQPEPGPGGDIKPATSKANEVGDQTMNQLRQGGSNTMGSGGKN